MSSNGGRVWQTAGGPVALDRPLLAGILNLTPDSFWEGSRAAGSDAVARATRLLDEGADLLDLGGESTRPGAQPVSAADEIARVVPVLMEIVRRWPDVPVSIDTVKAEVAIAALDAGAWIINDVSALRLDPDMAGVIAERSAGVVLMHSRGSVEQMARYEMAEYRDDAVVEVRAELSAALEHARATGVPDACVVLDPGLGFAKRTAHSVAVIAHLDQLLELGRPIMVGPSRKRFVGELVDPDAPLPPAQRLEGTLAACVVALLRGARLFRVHDVAATRRALAVAEAIRLAS
jgi:dihydropteroate synthase